MEIARRAFAWGPPLTASAEQHPQPHMPLSVPAPTFFIDPLARRVSSCRVVGLVGAQPCFLLSSPPFPPPGRKLRRFAPLAKLMPSSH
ncbi:hypothetical protein VPH35_074290 [Triticum aestivum]